jgi:uncharacterized YccA/Bax inhibitor family protein
MIGGNPVLNADRVGSFQEQSFEDRMTAGGSTTMTRTGSVMKSALLTGIVLIVGTLSWLWAAGQGFGTPAVSIAFFGGLIGSLVLGLVIAFVPRTAPFLAPVYAVLEGVFLGIVSMLFEQQHQAIVAQAVGLTALTLLVMLTLYGTGMIQVTAKLRAGIVAATGAIFLFYALSFIAALFGFEAGTNLIRGSGWLGIGISVVIVGVAAFNLLLDFDFIEKGSDAALPKHMEWYAGWGLLVTLVWLYIEMLRLLSKLRR